MNIVEFFSWKITKTIFFKKTITYNPIERFGDC